MNQSLTKRANKKNLVLVRNKEEKREKKLAKVKK
jgi:hypothetical protein